MMRKILPFANMLLQLPLRSDCFPRRFSRLQNNLYGLELFLSSFEQSAAAISGDFRRPYILKIIGQTPENLANCCCIQ